MGEIIQDKADWAKLLLTALEESPLLLQGDRNFCKRNLLCNSWQCHILCCMFSCLAPRIRSEIINWSFHSCPYGQSVPTVLASPSFSFASQNSQEESNESKDAAMMEVAMKETFHAIKEAEIFFRSCQQHDDWGLVDCLVSTACTGEALTVHIHNLFWCASSLFLTTSAEIGCSEERLNTLVEDQVHCWSTHIARYVRLGVELLDLKQLVMASETLHEGSWPSSKEDSEVNMQAFPAGMLRLLMLKVKLALLKSSASSELTDQQEDDILRDLEIDSKDLFLEKEVGRTDKHMQEEMHYCHGTWLSRLHVIVNKCTKKTLKDQVLTLIRLRNPFILQFIAWSNVSCDDSCYLVMESAEKDLKSFIKRRHREDHREDESTSPPFAFSVALDMILQIARGMWYLHRNGVAHGSLQASKVLLDPSKVPELQGESYACLKILYDGQHDVETLDNTSTFSNDVLSFGHICLEILTGKPCTAFIVGEQEQPSLFLKPPLAIPLLLMDCIMSCCHMHPQNRPEFGAICGLLRHIKLIVAHPNRLERLLNFFPEEDNSSNTKSGTIITTSQCSITTSQCSISIANLKRDPSSPISGSYMILELININVNVLRATSPPEIYPLVVIEHASSKEGTIVQHVHSACSAVAAMPLRLKDLEKMSLQLMHSFIKQHGVQPDEGLKFVVASASTLKSSLVEGFSGLITSSWTTTSLGMGTLEMWLPHLPADWRIAHYVALEIALCLRHVSKTPPKLGYYSEQGIDGFYPIHPANILINCQFKAALMLSNSLASWQRLFQWAGSHPQVGSANGDNILLSIESYTTYYFGHLLSSILKAQQLSANHAHNKRIEFVLSNLSTRCILLKYLSMTEVVTILLNEFI